MKIAIVHYWLVQMRGGEKVLRALTELFPDADVYTHVLNPNAVDIPLGRGEIKTSFISNLPGAMRNYQIYLPLMPLALEQLDLSKYDLVISSEAGPAKGVIVRPDALHICYCHSPMRYIWDLKGAYTLSKGWQNAIAAPFLHYLRMWDVVSAARVDHFIANSSFVAQRIEKFYRRSATIIHPPVDTELINLSKESEDFYLVIGQLSEYKKALLVVEAFNKSGRSLVVIGDGEQLNHLRAIASPNVAILGYQPNNVLRSYLQRCKALIFPGIEDFGIVPVEAMAAGKPVLAYAAGGTLDTVIDGRTGLFFFEQTIESLEKAIKQFEFMFQQFDANVISNHASTFSKTNFLKSITNFIDEKLIDRSMHFATPAVLRAQLSVSENSKSVEILSQ
jgi:glycosyltransferase involved in cell wall biosynthesis